MNDLYSFPNNNNVSNSFSLSVWQLRRTVFLILIGAFLYIINCYDIMETITKKNFKIHFSSRKLKGIANSSHQQQRLLSTYISDHPFYQNLMNFEEDSETNNDNNDDLTTIGIPYFWHIHKSGGSTMKHILSSCFDGRLSQTRRGSSPECNDKDDTLYKCPSAWGNAINADASSLPGIERFHRLLHNTTLTDNNTTTENTNNIDVNKLVVVTSRVYEALQIFQPIATNQSLWQQQRRHQHRGRLFVILRHPIERAVSKYYYGQIATWEKNYDPAIQNLTLMEYAESSQHCIDNWMTRRLVDKMNTYIHPTITKDDVQLAKELLREKAFILLLDRFDESIHRLAEYFHWNGNSTTSNNEQEQCVANFTKYNPVNQNPHPLLSKESEEWNAIQNQFLYDIELYDYAVKLYNYQGIYLKQRKQENKQKSMVEETE